MASQIRCGSRPRQKRNSASAPLMCGSVTSPSMVVPPRFARGALLELTGSKVVCMIFLTRFSAHERLDCCQRQFNSIWSMRREPSLAYCCSARSRMAPLDSVASARRHLADFERAETGFSRRRPSKPTAAPECRCPAGGPGRRAIRSRAPGVGFFLSEPRKARTPLASKPIQVRHNPSICFLVLR